MSIRKFSLAQSARAQLADAYLDGRKHWCAIREEIVKKNNPGRSHEDDGE